MVSSKYRAFITTAETGNITRAAEKLGYTQSGVSRLVGALELELGFQLLIRSKTGAVLTPEGEAVLPYIRKVLESEQNLHNIALDLKDLRMGELRIGTFSSVAFHWLPNLLSRFKEQYPDVEISIFNGDYAQIEERLLHNTIDCGFVTLPSCKEFSIQRLTKDRLLAILPEDSSLGRSGEMDPRQLVEETFIMPAEGSNYDIGKIFSQAGIVPQKQLAINDDYAAVEMVRQRLGVTILPELLVRDIPKAGLRMVPLQNTDREIGIATHKDRYISPATRMFLKTVESLFLQKDPQ